MLSADEQALLAKIVQANHPVAGSSFFESLNPPAPGLNEDHPEHEAWTLRQMDLYGAYVGLYEKGMIQVVVPADGANPDKVTATEAGQAAAA